MSRVIAEIRAAFDPLIGDKRTRRTFQGTVRGIFGAESLVCYRIAASSPPISRQALTSASSG